MADLDHLRSILADLYAVDRELDPTTLGPAYAAETRDGDPVVLCTIDPRYARRMSQPEQFVRELERSRALQHGALVPLAGAGITPDETLYFAMHRPDGQTARARLARSGTMPAVEVAAAGARLADALATLHGAGMLHGGVVPERIHLGAHGARSSHHHAARHGTRGSRAADGHHGNGAHGAGDVRLSGTGLHAALLAAGLDRGAVATALAGPDHLTPEQRSGSAMGPWSDIYALGAALYELLTGKRPLGGRATRAVMANVLADEPASEEARDIPDPELSEHIVEVVLRAVEQAPEDRWGSAADFAAALAQHAEHSRHTRADRAGHRPGPLSAVADLLKLGTSRRRRNAD